MYFTFYAIATNFNAFVTGEVFQNGPVLAVEVFKAELVLKYSPRGPFARLNFRPVIEFVPDGSASDS